VPLRRPSAGGEFLNEGACLDLDGLETAQHSQQDALSVREVLAKLGDIARAGERRAVSQLVQRERVVEPLFERRLVEAEDLDRCLDLRPMRLLVSASVIRSFASRDSIGLNTSCNRPSISRKRCAARCVDVVTPAAPPIIRQASAKNVVDSGPISPRSSRISRCRGSRTKSSRGSLNGGTSMSPF